MGPMVAACRFANRLAEQGLLGKVERVSCELYGSLALTGVGHGTPGALQLGLEGQLPETLEIASKDARLESIKSEAELMLCGKKRIAFRAATDISYKAREFLPEHPNGMILRAWQNGVLLCEEVCFSIGGGVVRSRAEMGIPLMAVPSEVPHPFKNSKQLFSLAEQHDTTVAGIMLANECALRSEKDVRAGIDGLVRAMEECVKRGCKAKGVLPGPLKVRRRARELYRDLKDEPESAHKDPLTVLDWVSLFALAVNEENAAGGRVVTAPTNGAAGVIPAVLLYFKRFCHGASPEKVHEFMLTAAAIGMLYKLRASISGAEVGCQGEVGVACSMAAGALTAVLGGSNAQVENAAEIGMEHNLGLTCDPVAGLVQVPCIERNAMGASKAINASRLALRGDGRHIVSLDAVIATMHQTGRDMQQKYKETSEGGLAVNVTEC